jgi:hypothetical protein
VRQQSVAFYTFNEVCYVQKQQSIRRYRNVNHDRIQVVPRHFTRDFISQLDWYIKEPGVTIYFSVSTKRENESFLSACQQRLNLLLVGRT